MSKNQIKSEVIGLVGPSGVGKGFYKSVLTGTLPNVNEPVVVTTRLKRPTDGNDRMSVDLDSFKGMVTDGEAILAHQPFGESGPWYGFLAASFSDDQPNLTEFHVDNVVKARIIFGMRLLLLGLITDTDYLSQNLADRGTEAMDAQNTRLARAMAEVESIQSFSQDRVIDDVIVVTNDTRSMAEAAIVSLSQAFLGLSGK